MVAPRTQPGTSTASASIRDGSTHHSLALKHAIRRFRALGGSRVLDLGPALGRNVQFLSHFISKLFIADLYTTIRDHAERSPLDRAKLDRILRRDLPDDRDGSVDLVFVWDLLDYLTPEQVEVVGRHLSRVCRKDGLILVLVSTLRVVPAQPGRYLILDPETLRYENDSHRERRAPGYKEPELERLMPAFEVETSYLLRSGIQEYVLTTRSVV